MKKLIIKILCISGLVSANVSFAKGFIPKEIVEKDYLKIKSDCKIQAEKDLKQLKSYGNNNVNSRWLTLHCIKSAAEIYIYNKDNPGKTEEQVYEETSNKVSARLDELVEKTDEESTNKYNCLLHLNLSMRFANATQDLDFIKRAIISYYISAKNDCEKGRYY